MINSKDLLINMKNTPDEDSQEYFDFWTNEREKCKNGIIIDSTFISGFLYYHLNFFKCQLDVLDNGRIIRKFANPYLRDNEWLIDGYIRKGEEEKKGVAVVGSRRLAKSVIEASYITHRATFFKGTQNVIAGLNEPDIAVITALCEEALTGLPEMFRHGRVEDNWKKQVVLGRKTDSGIRQPFSYIPIRNLDGGKNTEALAGLSPFSMVIDEIGKGDWLKCFSAAIPGFSTPFGWRCSPLCFGTSGDMDKAGDAKKVFESPEAYNFISVEIPNEVKKTSVFISGHYAHDFPKDTVKLNEYLNLPKDKHPNLNKIDIQVTNMDRAEKMIQEERFNASKSNDNSALLKITMYHPRTPQEVFLTDSYNNFPVEACRAQQIYLNDHYTPVYVDLIRNKDNTVSWKESFNLPITNYPVKPSDYKIAPIQIREFPQGDAPNGTYCIGVDAYNSNESIDKVNSLGAIYVYKRMYNPLGECQNQFVAWYAGRPNHLHEFYQIALDTAEFYNGYVLPELNQSFIDYFVYKKKGYLLWDTPQLAKDILVTSRASNTKGLTASLSNIKAGMNALVEYNKEDLFIEEESETPKQVLGVSRIYDPMLLEEEIQYRASKTGGHEINCDRIVAAYHALLLARHLDKVMPLTNWVPNSNVKEENIKKHINVRAFGNSFTNTSKTPFKPFGDSAPIKKPRLFGF